MLKISKGPGPQKELATDAAVGSCSITYYISVTQKVA